MSDHYAYGTAPARGIVRRGTGAQMGYFDTALTKRQLEGGDWNPWQGRGGRRLAPGSPPPPPAGWEWLREAAVASGRFPVATG